MGETKNHHILTDLLNAHSLIDSRLWEPLREDVNISIIYDQGENGPRAAFLHYLPGASVPEHEHIGYEHIFILHGAQQDDKGVYEQGTLVIHEPGSRHRIHSPKGCIALGIWQKPVQFLAG